MNANFLRMKSSLNSAFRVACGEMIVNDMSRVHKEVVFGLLKSGTITIETNSGVYELKRGDIFFIAPNQKYKINEYSDASINAVFVNLTNPSEFFQKDFFMEITLGNCSAFVKVSPENYVYNRMLDDLKTIYNAEIKKQEFFQLLVNSKMYEIFYLLFSSGLAEIYDIQGKKYRALRRITDYINDNYCEGVTLDSISQETGFSRYYISHLFKEILNSSFIGYINELRLARATSLLKTTQISIIDIARMSGFNNISNFNRTFKIYYKLTPSKFRKKEMQALGIELEK